MCCFICDGNFHGLHAGFRINVQTSLEQHMMSSLAFIIQTKLRQWFEKWMQLGVVTAFEHKCGSWGMWEWNQHLEQLHSENVVWWMIWGWGDLQRIITKHLCWMIPSDLDGTGLWAFIEYPELFYFWKSRGWSEILCTWISDETQHICNYLKGAEFIFEWCVILLNVYCLVLLLEMPQCEGSLKCCVCAGLTFSFVFWMKTIVIKTVVNICCEMFDLLKPQFSVNVLQKYMCFIQVWFWWQIWFRIGRMFNSLLVNCGFWSLEFVLSFNHVIVTQLIYLTKFEKYLESRFELILNFFNNNNNVKKSFIYRVETILNIPPKNHLPPIPTHIMSLYAILISLLLQQKCRKKKPLKNKIK